MLSEISLVESEIVGRGGAIVLAHGVNGFGIVDGAEILRQGLRGKWLLVELVVVIGIRADHPLGEIEWLGEEEPVPVAKAECHIGSAKRLAGRDNVERRQLQHALRMIERHPVGAASAAVVSGDEELLEAQ